MSRMASENAYDLFEKVFGTEIKVAIVALFHENPEIVDTMEGIASRLNRKLSQVENNIIELVDAGLLAERTFRGKRLIFLNKDKDREVQQHIIDVVSRRPIVIVNIYKTSRSPYVKEAREVIQAALKELDVTFSIQEIDLDAEPRRAIQDLILAIPTIDIGRKRIMGVPSKEDVVSLIPPFHIISMEGEKDETRSNRSS
jgi:hypothetical protein